MKWISNGGGSHASSRHVSAGTQEASPIRPARTRRDDTQDLPPVSPAAESTPRVQSAYRPAAPGAPEQAATGRVSAQTAVRTPSSPARREPSDTAGAQRVPDAAAQRVQPVQAPPRSAAQTFTGRVSPAGTSRPGPTIDPYRAVPSQTAQLRAAAVSPTGRVTSLTDAWKRPTAATGSLRSQTGRMTRPIPGAVSASMALPATANGRAYIPPKAAAKQAKKEKPAPAPRRTESEPTQAELDAVSRLPDAGEGRRARKKKKSVGKRLAGWGIALAVLVCLYFFCVYTSIPFIANLRSLYIETAMTTMEHQWLATYFIPRPVIQRTMAELDKLEARQDTMESDWSAYNAPTSTVLPSTQRVETPDGSAPDGETDASGDPGETVPEPVVLEFWEDPEHDFWKVYTELDYDSFHDYALTHRDEMYSEDGYLFIDEADAQSKGTSILTTNGDSVLAIDSKNGVILARLKGAEYEGVLAIVKDPKQISMGIASRLGVTGSKIGTIAEENNAILAINASGFQDDNGQGNGGVVYGMLYSEGVKIKGTAGSNYKAIYFDSEYRLNVRSYSRDLDIYNGVEFKPALVINGEAAVSGSAGWGIQPRSAIGQTDDGTVLMIIIDGRQPTYSVGITVGDLAKIFLDYGAVQAGNLDGGSSAVMYYNGRIITKPSGADKTNGRRLPDAFVVRARDVVYGAQGEAPAEEETEE